MADDPLTDELKKLRQRRGMVPGATERCTTWLERLHLTPDELHQAIVSQVTAMGSDPQVLALKQALAFDLVDKGTLTSRRSTFAAENGGVSLDTVEDWENRSIAELRTRLLGEIEECSFTPAGPFATPEGYHLTRAEVEFVIDQGAYAGVHESWQYLDIKTGDVFTLTREPPPGKQFGPDVCTSVSCAFPHVIPRCSFVLEVSFKSEPFPATVVLDRFDNYEDLSRRTGFKRISATDFRQTDNGLMTARWFDTPPLKPGAIYRAEWQYSEEPV